MIWFDFWPFKQKKKSTEGGIPLPRDYVNVKDIYIQSSHPRPRYIPPKPTAKPPASNFTEVPGYYPKRDESDNSLPPKKHDED